MRAVEQVMDFNLSARSADVLICAHCSIYEYLLHQDEAVVLVVFCCRCRRGG